MSERIRFVGLDAHAATISVAVTNEAGPVEEHGAIPNDPAAIGRLFTPADDAKNNVWYLRDIAAMAAAKHWANLAPFYVEQESPAPPGGLPKSGKLAVNLPDNHLQYAITWFGLALALAGVYLIWLIRRFRRY